jgi:hypothetical protein
MSTHFIKKGFGFTVSQDFARATADTPIVLAPGEYAKPGHVIGYIPEDPSSSLGFLRYGSKGYVRVHVMHSALGVAQQSAEVAS